MDTAPTYLIYQLFYRITEFLRHWYIKSVRIYWHFIVNTLEKIDYVLAWKITLKYLFKPLYKDYSVMGYILGFIFRSLRLAVTSVIYLVIFAVAAVLYLIWLAIPVIIIFKILTV